MKRILCILLCLVMLFLLTCCGKQEAGKASKQPPEAKQGNLISTYSVTNGTETVTVTYTWEENKCSWQIGETGFAVTYNPERRSLNLLGRSDSETVALEIEDFLVFDEQGRMTELNVDVDNLVKLHYEENKVVLDQMPESDEAYNKELTVNREEGKVGLFAADANSFAYYNEHGDLTGISIGDKKQNIMDHRYDEAGNRTQQIIGDGMVVQMTYTKEPATHMWQDVPAMLTDVYLVGMAFSILATRMIGLGTIGQ